MKLDSVKLWEKVHVGKTSRHNTTKGVNLGLLRGQFSDHGQSYFVSYYTR